jgi:hypothetical protein
MSWEFETIFLGNLGAIYQQVYKEMKKKKLSNLCYLKFPFEIIHYG